MRRFILALATLALPGAIALAQTPAPDRSHAVLEAIHRSGAAQRCWNAFLQHQPDAPSVRFRLRVEVNDEGAVTQAAVLDPTPSLFANCVRNEVRHAAVPAGPAITVETTYSFAAATPAPIPAH
jgi:hypothetical protein